MIHWTLDSAWLFSKGVNTMKRITRCLMILALLGFSSIGAVWANGDGVWVSLSSMPSRRQEISTAVLNGEIYVIAGYNQSGASTNTVEVYNPGTDTWRRAAPLPIATNHNAAAVAAGILYAFGGTSNRTFAYDPKNDAWLEVSPMRYQHGNTPAVTVIDDL